MKLNGKRLFVFDMDGTLIPGTTGLLELAKVLGTVDELRTLEKRFSAGELDTVGFTRQISSLWGRISDEEANAAFENSPKLEGITDVVQQVRDLGGATCIVTMSQDVFANGFKSYGFDHIIATPYPPHNDHNFNGVLKPADKVPVVKQLASKLGLDFAETVAFGDSISDVELFAHVEHCVAVNGDEHVMQSAAISYIGNSIFQAFEDSKCLWSSV